MLHILESFLKLSKSVMFELIPADEINVERKTFDWHLVKYDENRISFKVNFHHPKFISVNGLDTLKITFSNAQEYLLPQNDQLLSVEDNFTIAIKIPPQGEDLMTPQELASAQATG